MSGFQRRRATRGELEQGQREMKVADERMKCEAESRGELPIHNGPEDEPEEKRERGTISTERG
jgi:hypothetical protein